MIKNLFNAKRLMGLGMLVLGCVIGAIAMSDPAMAQFEAIDASANKLFKLILRFTILGAGFVLVWKAVEIIKSPGAFEWKDLLWMGTGFIIMMTAGALVDLFTGGGAGMSGVFAP